MNANEESHYWVTLEPSGRRVLIPAGASLLDAARQGGIELMAACGGNGSCGMCRVLPAQGKFSPLLQTETDQLQPGELRSGMRLACCVKALSDCTVQFPRESLATLQRLQLEGKDNGIVPHPAVQRVELACSPAQFQAHPEALTQQAGLSLQISAAWAARVAETLQSNAAKASLVVKGDRMVAVIPPAAPMLGLAVDLGTTKIAGYLVDLQTGHTLAAAGIVNPQIAYGEDVISRIQYTNTHSDGDRLLQAVLVQAINELLAGLCRQVGAAAEQVVDCVMVGNTALHHLLVGLPVQSLGTAPYTPAVTQPLEFPAALFGLTLAEGACLYLPPNLAGFVGGDHLAMLLATQARERGKTVVALDIGTNTEISLIHRGRHLACSCASGPAFEGAHIRDGLRAVPGAIERLFFEHGQVKVQTIQNKPAIGICGSGILDAVAEMRRENLIDGRGSFIKGDARFSQRDGKLQLTLVSAQESGCDREIAVQRRDVNEIQLAKAAIRAGVEVLLREAGISAGEIDLFLVAGAFGSYLDLRNAVRIGMFPPLPLERFQQVGNAAGSGAREMLLSTLRRRDVEQMVSQIEYVELTTVRDYADFFMQAIGL